MSATFRVPLVGHTIWNQFPVTSTGSENVTVRFAVVVTPVAPPVGTVALTDGAWSVENDTTWSAAIASGGSPASWSVTWAAIVVHVQLSPRAKSAFGSMVKVVGPPLTTVSATFRVPLVVHTTWNQFPATSTGSENVTTKFSAGSAAPASTGLVTVTDGGRSTV